MKSKWMTHGGKSYFYCDYSGFNNYTKALEEEVLAVESILHREPPHSVLQLVDVRGTVASLEATRLIKESAKRGEPFARSVAVIGVTGIVRVLADGVAAFSGMKFKLFNDIELAKDWLVSQG